MKVIGLTEAQMAGLTRTQRGLVKDWRAGLLSGVWANRAELERDFPQVLADGRGDEVTFMLERREGFGVVAVMFFPNQLARCLRVGLVTGTTRAGAFQENRIATAHLTN